MELDLSEEEVKDIKTVGFITARAWRKMATDHIFMSLSIAGRELEHRELSISEAIDLLDIANQFISIATYWIKQLPQQTKT